MKMKSQGRAALPRFLVVALATAGFSVANGATAQISFATTVVSSSAGIANFTGDLSGDGVWDLTWIFVGILTCLCFRILMPR